MVFTEGVTAEYVYDFGSSTELLIKFMGRREGKFKGFVPKIMARNLPQDIKCCVCGAPATELCVYCIYDDKGEFCDQHAAEHKCGPEALLPVVNSPRMGVCGYTGEGM